MKNSVGKRLEQDSERRMGFFNESMQLRLRGIFTVVFNDEW